MSSSTRFCTACLLPAESSILSTMPPPCSSFIKNLFRRQLSKKSSSIVPSHFHNDRHQHFSTRKFQRIKGTNIVREVTNNSTPNTTNYDMTILHNDELKNTQLAMIRRRTKKIPRWAEKSQLQIGIINQVYFQANNPDDLFGIVRLDLAREMINSMEISI